jgi:hypothetical protein
VLPGIPGTTNMVRIASGGPDGDANRELLFDARHVRGVRRSNNAGASGPVKG